MYAYAGSFTTQARGASGLGIGVYRTAAEGERWTLVEQLRGLVNPSFLVANRSGTVLYAAHGDQTYVSAFSIDRESGKLTDLGQCETGGENGVKLLLDPSEKFAIVANYTSGDVSVLPVDSCGRLSSPIHKIMLPGAPRRWARAGRQNASHPHDLVFDSTGRFLIVPDLGLDCIFVLAFDSSDGSLTLLETPRLIARACSGPRHAVVQGDTPYVWVLNELDSTVSALRFDAAAGTLSQIDIFNALPGDCNLDNTAGEIVYEPRTDTVYVSNRGHDSIAIFGADTTSGRLTARGWLSTAGRGPRFMGFGPDPNHVCVANEKSGDVQIFNIDAATGQLAWRWEALRTPSPTWIAFVS